MTEAAIDTATSSTHLGRHKPFLKILVLTVLPVLWSIAINNNTVALNKKFTFLYR